MNEFIPITGLNRRSCNNPTINPTIAPVVLPFNMAKTTTIINPVLGETSKIQKEGIIVLSNIKFIRIVKIITKAFTSNLHFNQI